VTALERLGWAIADMEPPMSLALTAPIPPVNMSDADDDLTDALQPLRLDPEHGVSVFWCGDRCGARVAVMSSMASDMGEGLWFLPGHAPHLRHRVGQRYVEKGLA